MSLPSDASGSISTPGSGSLTPLRLTLIVSSKDGDKLQAFPLPSSSEAVAVYMSIGRSKVRFLYQDGVLELKDFEP